MAVVDVGGGGVAEVVVVVAAVVVVAGAHGFGEQEPGPISTPPCPEHPSPVVSMHTSNAPSAEDGMQHRVVCGPSSSPPSFPCRPDPRFPCPCSPPGRPGSPGTPTPCPPPAHAGGAARPPIGMKQVSAESAHRMSRMKSKQLLPSTRGKDVTKQICRKKG